MLQRSVLVISALLGSAVAAVPAPNSPETAASVSTAYSAEADFSWKVVSVLPVKADKTFVLAALEDSFSHKDAAFVAFNAACKNKQSFTALFTVPDYPEESFFVQVTFVALEGEAVQGTSTITVVGLTQESAQYALDVVKKACASSFPVGKVVAGAAVAAVGVACCVAAYRRAPVSPLPRARTSFQARLVQCLVAKFGERGVGMPLILSTFDSSLSDLEAQLIDQSGVKKILILSSVELRADLSKVGSVVDSEYSVLERNAQVLRQNRVLIIQVVDDQDDKTFFESLTRSEPTRPQPEEVYKRLFSDPDWRGTYDPRDVLLFVRPSLAYVQGIMGRRIALPGGLELLQYVIQSSVHHRLYQAFSGEAHEHGMSAWGAIISRLATFAVDVTSAGGDDEQMFAPYNVVSAGHGLGRTKSSSDLAITTRSQHNVVSAGRGLGRTKSSSDLATTTRSQQLAWL